jgi:cell division GTPase FtsZ
MKILVIGCGQCGGRIADHFARLNMKARVRRGIDVVTNAIAVNSDVTDLSGLSFIKPNYQHRILIGGQRTGGHGVGKINEIGADLARDDGDKIIESIVETDRFHETDAFLIIAGAAGGTGSGAISVITQQLKERYIEKPVYNMIILPFKHEDVTEARSVYNVATCLKSSYSVADAIFLVDNQRYVSTNASIGKNLAKINSVVVEPFYNLLCAGEETEAKYVGSKTLDAGDIIQTLEGWTVIGFGQASIPRFKISLGEKSDFRGKSSQTQQGTKAMDQAISGLSLRCDPKDARKAMYLLTGPSCEMSVDMIKELSDHLKNMASEAIIRSGDYPREKNSLSVTLIVSGLTNARRVMDYFARAIGYIAESKRRRGEVESRYSNYKELFSEIPSLL